MRCGAEVRGTAGAIMCALVMTACGGSATHHIMPTPSAPSSPSTTVRTPARPASAPAHVVIVMEENHSAADIADDPNASYLHQLAATGVSLTDFFAITHPSQPNYLALFSGSTHGLTSDSCPHTFAGANLGSELRAAGRTFVGYSEGLPRVGSSVCSSGDYARKHAPWTNFTDLPRSVSQPFSAFPRDYETLPTVSFVIPDLQHDMHDGTVAAGDAWLRHNLGGYVRWAAAHDSVLIVTWDEDDHSEGNRIPAILVGAGIRHGTYGGHADLYGLLRTLEWFYGLPALGQSAHRAPIPVAGLR